MTAPAPADAAFYLDADEVDRWIKEQLGPSFSDLTVEKTDDSVSLCDTFDWRLFRSGHVLVRYADTWALTPVGDTAPILVEQLPASAAAKFAWDLPAGPMQDALGPLLSIRALTNVVQATCRHRLIHVKNKDAKTIVRVAVTNVELPAHDRTICQIRLLPLRGYGNATAEVLSLIETTGAQPVSVPLWQAVLEASNQAPGAYATKIQSRLMPGMPARAGLAPILQELSGVMSVNIPGMKADIDTEFLHDFRVSVRRGRSLLSQMPTVLPADRVAEMKRDLRQLGQWTTHLRDLDVYLLSESQYAEMLPDTLRPGLTPLFASLKRRRGRAFKKLLDIIDSEPFASIMNRTAAVGDLADPVETDGAATTGDQPIQDIACKTIYRRYRKIIKKGNRITDQTPDEAIHELRIDCKKLRYLMEAFGSLFPKKAIGRLIKQLKGLQNHLGLFNDLSVQQAFLVDYLAAMTPKSTNAKEQAAAAGGLITRLHVEQRRLRDSFLSVFTQFAADANQRRFAELFASREDAR